MTPSEIISYVLCFRVNSLEARCVCCGLSVEFGHWNAAGRHLWTKHGSRVNDGGRADLKTRTQSRQHFKTKARACLTSDSHQSQTDHQTEVTRLQLLLHFSEDLRVQSLSEPDDVRPQQPITALLITPAHITIHAVLKGISPVLSFFIRFGEVSQERMNCSEWVPSE